MQAIKNLLAWLKRPSSTSLGALLIVGFLAGLIFTLVFHFTMSATNSMEICLTCHSMDFPYQEYKETKHFQNPSGVRATCADCHVPHDKNFFGWLDKIWFKITIGGKDMWHTLLGTLENKEKYDAKRWELANNVWKSMKERDSKECRYCHNFEVMNLEEQSRSASKKHKRAMEEGGTCIDCHQGIAHELPEEPSDETASEEKKEETKESK